MYEKRFKAVPPQAFTVNGTAGGQITIANTKLFKVKQKVTITGNALPRLELEVKRIDTANIMYVGPTPGNIDTRTDLSAYTTAASSAIFALEQPRPSVPEQEVERITYEEEPTVARRVTLVDPLGDKYDTNNRIPVDAVVNLTASKPRFHTIFNELVVSPNVEQSVMLPDKTEIITIMVRSNKACKLQYSFVVGESGTKFITVMPGVRKEINNIGLSGVTPLYFQLSLTEPNGTIVEIETWNS